MHQKLTGQFRINQTNMKVICFKSGYMQGCSYPFKKTINIKITLKSATTRLYDTEAKIICIVSKKGAQCIECHHKDI